MSNQLKTIKVKEKINVNAIKHIAKNDTAKQNELLDELYNKYHLLGEELFIQSYLLANRFMTYEMLMRVLQRM